MMQLDDVLKAYRSGSLSAPQALEQLRAARPTLPPYPLSDGQRGLWVLEKSASGESGYNVPVAFRVRGRLSVERLHAACEFLWSQHPVLRTVIEQADSVLQQRIAPRTSVPWSVEASAPATDDALRAYLRDQAKTPFVLEQGPLLRIHVVRRSSDEHIVLFVIHHLVFDGTSLGVLLRTVLGAYDQLQRGERLIPVVLPASYRDFVAWEHAMLESPAGQAHRAYWLQQLAGDLPVLALPTDQPRATHASVAGRTHVRVVSGEQVQRIRAVCAELDVSMSVVLLGVYQLLLHRYTGETDIVVGVPTAGRPQARFDDLIGYFVNVIALRHRIAGGDAFAAWARSLQSTLVEGLDHASYPFARVVRDLRIERRQPRAAIFQVAYEYQNASMLTPGGLRAASPDGLVIEAVEGLHQEGEYELVLEVVERATDLALHFKHDASLYAETTIARMADHYLNLLQQVLEQPGLPLSAYAPMTVAESRQVLESWNATAAAYPRDRGIHELFAEQARRTPQATAVTFDGQQLTYRELDEHSDQLARQLGRDGVRAGDRVALCVERSLDLPIGLLGILKSGAAYVPLDPTYPRDRLAYMLTDSGARVVVTQSRQLHLFAGAALRTVCLDDVPRLQDTAALPAPARGDALAYVMYTSGSTGRPKGVMICHRAVVNFLASMARAPGLDAQDRLLAVTTYSFDISGLEIYLPLVTGAECHICSTEHARDPKLLAQEIARVRPTVMQATPTTWSMLVRIGWQNREGVKILCGGEALPQALRQHFVRSGWDAWNLYGPTETTIWSTIERITAADGGSIGRPIANTRIYILDAYRQAAAVLVPGELCIAGDGLAAGYLDQPTLTAEKFVADPFRPGHKMYRTGDLACWRPDGTIEYLGRGDGQVKVRGHRVELGEIEARLAGYPGISGCAVVVCERDDHEYLAACCVLAGPLDLTSTATVRALREYLQAGLPDYMVPSRFLGVTALPLTPNGKLDRKRLAEIATAAQRTVEQVVAASAPASAPPSSAGAPEADSEIVERVRRIWQRVLGSAGMGLDDGFFDLGGDSVMAVTVAARIESEFGCAFGATEMFRFGTIRRIARHLQGPQPAPRMPAPPEPAPIASAPRVASSSGSADDRDCVAIIGISCQFPGANDHRQFWSNLVHGVESIQRLSPEALARAGVPASTLADANYVPVQATIDGTQFFDAEFFKVSPRDAELMDPQLRLLLQHGWKVVEDAGYAARAIPETGVWIATSRSDYATRAHGTRGAATGVLGSMHEHVPWLLAQSGTIPTMISHRLGFKGPSQAVHANCSSSLVAINAAYRSLMGGETKYALVGAATIFAGDSLGYVHEAGMPFSSDGHVRTFDAAADGTVGGEGVAVVLLKRAADAIADGDHIYALIRGVAVNNDGTDKAGFYAPSVEGQTDVIVKALQVANVDARSIGYVEAHGTATALGDPIEVQAISAAYRRYTADTEFCGIGSVKTNIGHVDTAAGLAGLIKVALSLEHGELPPTLHYRQPNPRLALRESPFYVVDQRRPWRQDAGARRAAVSAFGIGGTNAHAILEEAPAARRDAAASDRPALIVLSARTAEQLRDRADQLLACVSTSQPAERELFDIAYTLQVGRDAMEHRVAFTAASVQVLRDRLRTFVEGGDEGLYRGEAHKDKETWAALTGDEEFAETIEKWLRRGKHERLLELWAKGVPVDWAKLYAPGGSYARPRRVSLPGYPFAKQRHWLEPTPVRATAEVTSVLHPLVQRNTSDLKEQRFSSTFDGTEFYLHDHVVNGRKILPAVCYLEMARVALERSAGPRDGHDAVVVLEDVVWMRPVVVDGAKDVHVGLREREDGEVEVEIYSDDLHAQARARLVDAGALDAERFDVEALRARCHEVIDGALCYATFRAVGVEYGPAHQGITRIHAGVDSDGQPFALAHVTLPVCVRETRDRYVLHPSMLDCALQATIGLSSSARLEPGLPFALERLEILGRSPDVAWIVVRPSVESSGSVRKLDIEICDEQGRVCVRMLGFSARAIAGALESPAPAASGQTMLLTPRWEARPLPELPAWPVASSRVVLIGGTAQQQQPWRQRYAQLQVVPIAADAAVERIADALRAHDGVDHVVWLAPASAPGAVTDEALIVGQEAGVLGLYRLIKALLLLGYGERSLGFTVVTWQCQAVDRREQADPTHAGVHGLVGSLAKEYEGWQVRLVDGQPEDDRFVEEVLHVPADPAGDAWAYRAGEWYRQQLIACELQGVPTAPYRQGGVYVVIGGAGGLGEVFSEHVIRNHGARLVWLGRSTMSAAIDAKIARLATLGPAPRYLACDAADRDSLEQAYRRIKAEHGQIHGVVHAAVVLLDRSLAQMEEDRFRASLAAKVNVSVRLAQVFAREALDFVVLFSSLQSFAKAAGQSNYGAGCTFQDAFASRLALAWPSAVKVMNWGYWAVGTVASEGYRTRMAQLGFGSIEPEEGMAALGRLLGGPLSQTVFLKTIKSQALPAERLTQAEGQAPSRIHSLSPRTQRTLAPQAAPEAVEAFQRMLGQLLFVQLRSMGLCAATSIAAWRQQVNLPALYGRWLDESLRVLADQGYLRVEAGGVVAEPTALDDAAAWSTWDAHRRQWAHDPGVNAQLTLADATLRALPEILRGRPATDVVFPDSSLALVEGIYKHNPVPDYFNAVLTDSLIEYVAARCQQDGAPRIRILEIGAGTGGTSAGIFERLKPYEAAISEYCYTDISKAFLIHAEQAYGPIAPYLTYRLFNVEQPLEPQGVGLGSFDVVIATNVLHATRSIRYTLRGAKAALKHNGLVLINEMSSHSLFAHVTFGLLEGWWLYDDSALRIPGSPVLAPETWQRVLETEGFGAIGFPASAAHGLGQQIIVAESDGVIRQAIKAEAPASTAPVRRTPAGKPAEASARATAASELRSEAASGASPPIPAPRLRELVSVALKQLIGDAIKTPPDQIDEHAPLEEYGMDSLLVVKLTNGLKEFFPDLASTLFFEHRTIASVAEYLVLSEERGVVRWVGEPTATVPLPAKADVVSVRAVRTTPSRRRAIATASTPAATNAATNHDVASRGIAIIGMSGRFPDARNVDELWDNLQAGRNCIREIPAERWDHRDYFDPQKGKPGKSYSKWGGFMEDVDKFDPLFFRMSPLEAEELDPQERLFLQEAYASIEDAGYTPAGLCASRKVGVYVGVMNSTYRQHSTYWSIANRVSYVCDFQGPSMAVDTACSSSLTAIHLAVESIRGGSCEVAIAGGVALIIDPLQYTSLSAMTMLSAGDRCKAFGAQADGFVDGEGVGALVLKPLDRAIQDGDHIYGVIRSSAVNAGGKTNGYTVPNPAAQRDVIQRALSDANIDPRTISYIEAHGTGTELGDPIEIAGLTQAFSARTTDKQYCAIGSAKSNIGHLESAAGVAGVTKVLLQMQHRALVPSLHSEVLNPHIDFSRTPFRVQHAVSEWRRPTLSIDGEEREYPRIAGISSFGAGGANAHVIIEEYEARAVATASRTPALIVLSAKAEPQLAERARRLLAHVSSDRSADLAAIAYTLQVGREAMDHRLAFTAATLGELRDHLSTYLAGRREHLHVDRVRRDSEALTQFATDEAMQAAAEDWIQRGQSAQLLAMWVTGLRVAWSKLYADGSPTGWSRPVRVRLPTYPFARERYWKKPEAPAVREATERALHPLLQRNTSNLSETRFSSTLSGEAFFLSDHVINGQRILPGVAYLEMARAALAVSLDLDATASPVIELRDLVWLRPLAVSDPRDVHIRLHALEASAGTGDEIAYEIYTGALAQAGEDAVHAEGRAVRLAELEWVGPIDIDSLRAQCDRSLDVARCYAAFDAMGVAYGAAHRGLASVHAGVDARGAFLLAQVKLPDCVSETRDAYVLHPSVLDSALQAAIGLSLFDGGDASSPRAVLPFALDRLQLLNRSPRVGWVVMRPSPVADSHLQKLDIDLCEESGHVCVRLQGFTSRVAEAPRARRADAATVLLAPSWEAKSVPSRGPDAATSYGERWVLLAGAHRQRLEELKSRDPSVKLAALSGDPDADSWLAASEQVLDCVRSILRAGPSHDVLVQVVVTDEPASELGAALAGLLKSARQENPRLVGQVVIVPPSATTDELERALHDNAGPAAMRDPEIRYAGGARQVVAWNELPADSGRSMPWRDGGVYLITGGAGGLGRIFAQEILERAQGAKVVLTGRSSLSAARRAQIEALRRAAPGSVVEYRELDVTDAAAASACVGEIQRCHGALHGILHAAGVARDAFILKKEVDELRAVWAPKVAGAMHLDHATRHVALDAFILFSSLSGVFGNVGQSDYALANAALDCYATMRNRLVEANERRGRTLSINWPLWEHGGMAVDAGLRETLQQKGLDALTTMAGVEAFYRAWASGLPQVMVLAGDRQRLEQIVTESRAAGPVAAQDPTQVAAERDDELRAGTIRYVRQRVAEALKLSPERIESDVGFEQYGIDSILALKVVRELETSFGSLPKTLLFEHQSVEALTSYLIKAHRAALVSQLKLPVAMPAPAAPSAASHARRASSPVRERSARAPRATEGADRTRDIAVIGLAGRYPGADDIHELWENLKAGKDCITEVPSHRWDHGKYYDAEKGKPGKTSCKWGGFIRGTETFDHAFFRLSAQDAQRMDPQERILLEVMWHLMEDAGYTSHHLRTRHQRNVGVYVGGHSLVEAGASTAYTASRITEFLGLRGPSFVVDTFSASSATALHLACQGLLAGDCQLAIAAGVCVLHPQVMIDTDGWLTTREDRRGFSTEGGFIFAEGAGAVLLKPLRDAVRDSDRILAVIKSTVLDSSGRAKRQFPSDPVVMANVIRSSLDKAGVAARTIGCAEPAATGAAANDYTEVSAYTTVFRETTADVGFCAMGTIESNVGHSVASSGIAQLTKAILQLHHGERVPTIKMDPVNPDLEIAKSPFFLPRTPAPWPRQGETPRRALVTSRGADGTQVAVVLEEPPLAAERGDAAGAQERLFLLSAPSPDRLRAMADALKAHLAKHPASDLGDLAYTLDLRREEMQHRLAVIAASADELAARLAEYADGAVSSPRARVVAGDAVAGRATLRELLDEQAEARLLRTYVAEHDLEKLARYWVSGSDVRGAGFGEASSASARVVALPLYPFASSRVSSNGRAN